MKHSRHNTAINASNDNADIDIDIDVDDDVANAS